MAKHKDEQENLRAEYSATNDAYLHYDNFTWQVGAILIVGAFAYWGFLLQSPPKHFLDINIGNFFVTLIMSIWLLYSSHNRQIYLYKLHRIHFLERELGMEQHLRFRNDFSDHYKVWPKGHYLDRVIYIAISVGCQTIALNNTTKSWECYNVILFITIPLLVIIVLGLVIFHEKRAKQFIKELEEKDNLLCA
jgi:hypothetical protein